MLVTLGQDGTHDLVAGSAPGAEGVGQDQEFPNFIHDFASSSRTRSRSATIPEEQEVEVDVVASLRKGRGAAAVEARGSKVGEARPYPPSCLARKRRRPPGFSEAFGRHAALLPSLWLPFSCLLPSFIRVGYPSRSCCTPWPSVV